MRRIVLTGVPPFEVQNLAGPLEVFAQCDYEIELVSPERDGSTAINRGLRVTGGTGGTLKVEGRQWWFCSGECAGRFEANPDAFQNRKPTT